MTGENIGKHAGQRCVRARGSCGVEWSADNLYGLNTAVCCYETIMTSRGLAAHCASIMTPFWMSHLGKVTILTASCRHNALVNTAQQWPSKRIFFCIEFHIYCLNTGLTKLSRSTEDLRIQLLMWLKRFIACPQTDLTTTVKVNNKLSFRIRNSETTGTLERKDI